MLLKDSRGTHYLHVFDGWMAADSLEGAWSQEASPPADHEKVKKEAIAGRQGDLLTGQAGSDEKAPSLAKGLVPAILVVTTPTDLIVTDDETKWMHIAGTEQTPTGTKTKSKL